MPSRMPSRVWGPTLFGGSFGAVFSWKWEETSALLFCRGHFIFGGRGSMVNTVDKKWWRKWSHVEKEDEHWFSLGEHTIFFMRTQNECLGQSLNKNAAILGGASPTNVEGFVHQQLVFFCLEGGINRAGFADRGNPSGNGRMDESLKCQGNYWEAGLKRIAEILDRK